MAFQRGLTFSHCEHIRSLDYCRDTAAEECLKEEVLSEMADLKLFCEAKKATCVKRQKNAQEAHVPLCVVVSFQESPKPFCFSIYDWHCPCAKPRTSCVHKDISRWHFFQTNMRKFCEEITDDQGCLAHCECQMDNSKGQQSV